MSKSKKNFSKNKVNKQQPYRAALRNKVQSPRQMRASHLIHAALLQCLRKASGMDVRLEGCPLTITKVTITADLRIAHCYFLPFNTELSSEAVMEALNNSKYRIRKFISDNVHMKYSPEIIFYNDLGLEQSMLIDELLKNTP